MFKIHVQDLTDNSVDYTLINICQDMIKQFCETAEPSGILTCLRVSKLDQFLVTYMYV